jgi:hypothetical protein
MITELTKEQEELLPVYRDKWLKIGLCTERVDGKLCERISNYYYTSILKKSPVPVVVTSSPLSAWYAVCCCSTNVEQVRAQVWAQVEAQVWAQVEAQVRAQVRAQVEAQVRAQVRAQVWAQVEAQVEAQVRAQVWARVKDFVYPYIDGHFYSSYFSFYDFMHQVLHNEFDNQENYVWYQTTAQIGLMYPLDSVCIISDRPKSINMKDGILHCESAPAIEYVDGFSFYCLNGVRVSKELVTTRAEELDPKLILTEQNAGVRREIVRKIGIERVCMKLGAECVDKKLNYELLLLDIGDNRKRPYLKMINPSIGVFHIEGVPPEIKSVDQALRWRNQSEESPIELT